MAAFQVRVLRSHEAKLMLTTPVGAGGLTHALTVIATASQVSASLLEASVSPPEPASR